MTPIIHNPAAVIIAQTLSPDWLVEIEVLAAE